MKLQRYKRNKILGDTASPQLYYLRPVADSYRTRTLTDLARDIELISSVSREDITHVLQSIARRMLTVLVEGDRVKIPGLGTFFVTFNCTGTEEEKDCTVRNIHKVNIRFKTDNTLRLVNDSIATTRNADNNVKFAIKGDADDSASGSNGDDDGGGYVDPDA